MRRFLEQLFATGEVAVPMAGTDFDMQEPLDQEILQFDCAARLSLAGEAPALNLSVASWAATLLAGAARLAIAREMGAEEIEKVFTAVAPAERSPDVDYSADLFLRYIPNLLSWVQRLAADDPLVEKLRTVAAAWPLSSVGVRELACGSIEPFIGHAGLRQSYVDRIIAARDASRLNDPRVIEAVRISLGAHPELSPEIAKAAGLIASGTNQP